MLNMRIARALLVSFLFAFGVAGAHACSCVSVRLSDRDEAAREFNKAGVVFEGEIVSVVRPPPAVPDLSNVPPAIREAMVKNMADNMGVSEIKFQIVRTYKGTLTGTVEFHLDTAGSDCSSQAKPGEKWFVYGFPGEKGTFTLSPCSRTNAIEGAGADIR